MVQCSIIFFSHAPSILVHLVHFRKEETKHREGESSVLSHTAVKRQSLVKFLNSSLHFFLPKQLVVPERKSSDRGNRDQSDAESFPSKPQTLLVSTCHCRGGCLVIRCRHCLPDRTLRGSPSVQQHASLSTHASLVCWVSSMAFVLHGCSCTSLCPTGTGHLPLGGLLGPSSEVADGSLCCNESWDLRPPV